MADSNYREYLKTAKVKAKKYFYVLRPILASKWIINYQEAPPIEFTKLVAVLMEDELKTIVIELLEEKKQTNEFNWINKIDRLNDYIEKELSIVRKIAEESLDKNHSQWAALNEFFLQLVLF